MHLIARWTLLLSTLVAISGCETVGLRAMRIYMLQQNWEKALQQGLLATQKNPTDVDAWFNTAAVAAQVDSFDIMLVAMNETLQRTNKYNSEIEQIRVAEYNDLFNAAVSNFNNSDLDRANTRLETALRIDSSRPNAPKLLGMIAQQQGNVQLAIEYYARVLEIDPSATDVERQYRALLAPGAATSVMKDDSASPTVSEWRPVVLKAITRTPTENGRLVIQLLSGDTISVVESDWSQAWSDGVEQAIENQVAQQAVQSSSEPPPEAQAAATIRSKCANKWPNDFRMQQYCREQQTEAFYTLRSRRMTGTLARIREECARKWPDDFRMRNYCEEQQIEAYRNLQR